MQENIEKKTILIKTIGKVIEKNRLALNKSIYEISAEVCITKETWRNIEKGLNKDIMFSNVWLISEALDIPLENLITEIKEELGEGFSLADLK